MGKSEGPNAEGPFCGGWSFSGLLFTTLAVAVGSALIFIIAGGLKMVSIKNALCASNRQVLFYLSPSLVALDAELEFLGAKFRVINCDDEAKGTTEELKSPPPQQSLDGHGNNKANPSWGSVGTPFRRRFSSVRLV